MKIRIQTIVFTLLLLTLLCGCSKEAKIKNVTRSEVITLKSSTKNPLSIWLAFRGRIEGEAKISLMLKGKPYRTQELTGDVDFKWQGDWYSSEATLEYDHGNAKSGNLTIKYDF